MSFWGGGNVGGLEVAIKPRRKRPVLCPLGVAASLSLDRVTCEVFLFGAAKARRISPRACWRYKKALTVHWEMA